MTKNNFYNTTMVMNELVRSLIFNTANKAFATLGLEKVGEIVPLFPRLEVKK